MPDITTHLPLSALQPFFDNARDDGEITEAWRDQYFGDIHRIVHPALIAFFKELKAEGRLVPIPSSAGYSCRLWEDWNAAARLDLAVAPANKAAAILDELAGRFAHDLVFSVLYPYEQVLETKDAAAISAFDKQAVYTKEMARFSKGNFPRGFGHENCQRTSLPLILRVADWVPRGMCIMDRRVVDVPPFEPEVLQETVFELKTGNLLVTDWFRIPAFTALVAETEYVPDSRKQRDAETRRMLQQFGVISLPTLASPGLFQAGNQILGGFFNEDEGEVPSGYTHLGNVCTDRWSTTFVEYETLVDLVAKENPETAKEIVDDYIEKHKGGVYGLHQITVEPGTYHLYHFGENDEFAASAKQAGLQLDAGDVAAFFVFSKNRLLSGRAE